MTNKARGQKKKKGQVRTAVIMVAAFDAEVRRLMRDKGWSRERARDSIIMDSLATGDTLALAHFLGFAHPLGNAVRHYLAKMLLAHEVTGAIIPFKLVAKRRDGRKGARPKHWRALRDKYINDRINEIVEDGYDAAVKEIASETGFGEQTIRDAYDRHKGKK